MFNTGHSFEKAELKDLYPIADEVPLLDNKSAEQISNNELNPTENHIDYVLIYDETIDDQDSFEQAQKAMRKNFEANLQHYGLMLTYRKIPLKNHRQRVFVLITTPFKKLLEMCEITRTYLPIDRINPFLCQLLTYPMLDDFLPKYFRLDDCIRKENCQRANFVFYPYAKRLHNKFARYLSRNMFTIGKSKQKIHR